MEENLYLLVKVTVRHSYKIAGDALLDLQAKTDLRVGSTKKVKVLKHEIIHLKTKTH